MFQVNDAIIYGVHGVCKIRGTEDRTVGGTTRTYLVLQPESDKGAAFFVPTDNPHVLEKIRRLLTKDQIHRLIDAMPENDGVWVEDENARRELYKGILTKGDHTELIRMLKAIYAHKKELELTQKRLHISDERFFKDAEQILYNEFQYVLGLESKEALMAYILDRIEKKTV